MEEEKIEAGAMEDMQEHIGPRIIVLRGLRNMLDEELAKVYGVTTSRLNEQFRRNRNRFPDDFVFQLTSEEITSLRSQSATSKGRGGRCYLPHAFTEHGAIMLATVLNTPAAKETNWFS
jgi:hypothetical protein